VPDWNVIKDVSQALRDVLQSGLSVLLGAPGVALHDLQSSPSTSPATLTIFLQEVIEDPSARNKPPQRHLDGGAWVVRKPPVALILRYMLTPWSDDRATDQMIIGRVVQVLYDGAILSGPQLQGSLAGTSEALKLTLIPLTLEERTRIWHALGKPYRLSLNYEVRVVHIDPIAEHSVVPAREFDTRVLLGVEP
jgi:hypothetical protein